MKIIDYVIIAMILGITLAFILTQTEQTGLNPSADVIGSDGYPKILAGLAVLCCAWMVGLSFYQKRQGQVKSGNEKQVTYDKATLVKCGVFCAAIILYILGFLYIGFCVSTFIFIAALTLYLESFARKSIPYAVAYGLAVTAVCQYVFSVFHLLTPDGLLF